VGNGMGRAGSCPTERDGSQHATDAHGCGAKGQGSKGFQGDPPQG